MYAPRVFVSMIGALTVFAVVTYFLNGSLTSTLIQTAICAVLIQIGYFLAVVFLIWRKRASAEKAAEVLQSANDDKPGSNSHRLDRPGHFNR